MITHKHIDIPDDANLYIVPDLHGSYSLYQKIVKMFGITKDDYVISLGDLTDRGKENFKCVEEFTKGKNRYGILGNHDQMMIKGLLEGEGNYYGCWIMNGGNTVIEEVGEEGATFLAMMLEENLPVILTANYRGKRLTFTHGGWPSFLEYVPPIMFEQWCPKEHLDRFLEAILWDRDMVECAKEGIKLPKVLGTDFIFHGHSYVKEPVINGNRIYMDCGGVFNGNLVTAYFDEQGNIQFYSTLEED